MEETVAVFSRISRLVQGLMVVGVISLLMAGPARAIQGGVKTVDCAKGQSIAGALAQADGNPITIEVRGTCNEAVRVDRDDVTLAAGPSGGTVDGPDPNSNTISVVGGSRVVIDGLMVMGGRNGIVGLGAKRLTIRNCTVQNTGRNGISFFQGSDGTVDSCTVQNNPRHGIVLEGGTATVINSTISANTEAGIQIFNGGNGRIGITNAQQFAGNVVSGNGGSGIHVAIGGTAFIGGNTISGNGTNPATSFGQFGITVLEATADLAGSNTITGNAGSGVFARSSQVLIGDQATGLGSVNTIAGNGAGVPATGNNGGVFGFLGAALDIRNASITGNTGHGVLLSTRSTARMFGDTVNNNTGDGIRLTLGGGLLLQTPAVVVTGNTGAGLQCADGESSFAGSPPALGGIGANGGGAISGTCTGF